MTNTLLTATAVPAQNLPGHRARFLSVFIFLVGFLVWTPPASAQTATGEVAGRVTNALTGRVINNARVAVPSLGRTVFTNEYGDFRVSGLPAGDVTLEVFFTGLDPQTVAVTVARVAQSRATTAAAPVPRSQMSRPALSLRFRVEGKAVRVVVRAVLRGLATAAMAARVGPSP
jgi:hypothetical protein